MPSLLRRRATLMPVLFAAVISGSFAFTQTPSPQPAGSAGFEVASIHEISGQALETRQHSDAMYSVSTYPAARFFAHSATLPLLFRQAYGDKAQYVTNYPDWINAQLYDVDATVEGGRVLSREEMQPLLQNLLTQRLHLKVHHEDRIVAGYEMVAAKGGAKLTPEKESARPKDLPSAFHAMLWATGLRAYGIPTQRFAQILAGPIGKPILDKTGLVGNYDIDLSYSSGDDPNSTLPDIFTAIQEQLGLKLVPAKVPVDYLVIDHVDRVPTEN